MNDIILIILMLLGFAAGAFVMWIWCSVAKDPYIDDHEEMFEKDLPPILKKQAD